MSVFDRKLWWFDYLFAYNEAFPSIILSQELLKRGQLSWQGLNVSSFARFLWKKNSQLFPSPGLPFPPGRRIRVKGMHQDISTNNAKWRIQLSWAACLSPCYWGRGIIQASCFKKRVWLLEIAWSLYTYEPMVNGETDLSICFSHDLLGLCVQPTMIILSLCPRPL